MYFSFRKTTLCYISPFRDPQMSKLSLIIVIFFCLKATYNSIIFWELQFLRCIISFLKLDLILVDSYSRRLDLVIKKTFWPTQFFSKNLYSASCATLCSKSVVMLITFLKIHKIFQHPVSRSRIGSQSCCTQNRNVISNVNKIGFIVHNSSSPCSSHVSSREYPVANFEIFDFWSNT